jgi:hypothetical protein
VWMYYVAFLRGDSAQMEQQVAWGAGKPGAEDPLLSAQSDTEAVLRSTDEGTRLFPACGRFRRPCRLQGDRRIVAGERCLA